MRHCSYASSLCRGSQCADAYLNNELAHWEEALGGMKRGNRSICWLEWEDNFHTLGGNPPWRSRLFSCEPYRTSCFLLHSGNSDSFFSFPPTAESTFYPSDFVGLLLFLMGPHLRRLARFERTCPSTKVYWKGGGQSLPEKHSCTRLSSHNAYSLVLWWNFKQCDVFINWFFLYDLRVRN